MPGSAETEVVITQSVLGGNVRFPCHEDVKTDLINNLRGGSAGLSSLSDA